MQARQISTKEADDQYKRAAFIDNHMRSVVNKTLYSDAQVTQAIRLQVALEMLYTCEKVYKPTFGKTRVSVKVSKPRAVANKAQLKLCEETWEKAGYTKKVSPQGILYSFKKV